MSLQRRITPALHGAAVPLALITTRLLAAVGAA